MGVLCSKTRPDDDACEPDSSSFIREYKPGDVARSKKRPMAPDSNADKDAAKRLIDAQETFITSLDGSPPLKRMRPVSNDLMAELEGPDDYFQLRRHVMARDKTLDFDYRCHNGASPLEKRVDSIIRILRQRDHKNVYEAAPSRRGHGGQLHRRFAGDHFLSNVDLINQTALLDVARHMPKGAHLHIHFNSCLLPHVLLDIAKGMDRMFITSDLPLVAENNYINFDRCEIQFSLRAIENEDPGDLFSPDYTPRKTMKFAQFLEWFPNHYDRATADEWLTGKLVFDEDEAHNLHQTAAG